MLLSGQARCPFRTGEHAIHCEHGVAMMIAGPLQRVVSWHFHHTLKNIEKINAGKMHPTNIAGTTLRNFGSSTHRFNVGMTHAAKR